MSTFAQFLESAAASLGGSIRALQTGWKKSWQDAFKGLGDGSGGHPGGSSHFVTPEIQSAWVSRCLRLIHGQITPLPLMWYFSAQNEQEPIIEPDLSAFWATPAETVNGPLKRDEFIQLTSDYMHLHGQAYWLLLGDWWNPAVNQKPRIIIAKPERMTPIRSFDLLLGWRFIDGAGHAYTLLPEQVIRPRIHNGHDDIYGLSALEAGYMAASGDHAAGVYQRNVAQANGDQGVYVIAKGGGVISDEQQRQIVAQLRQKRELARRGDFRAAFLTGDVTVEDPKVHTVDDAFINGRNFSRDEIATAFGVPCSMLQMTTNYSIGSASDRFRLVEETCIPISRIIASAMMKVERLRTARDLHAEFHWDNCTVLVEARNERFKQAVEMWRTGVPWAVLNMTFDLGMPDFPGAETVWLPINLEAKGDYAPPQASDKQRSAPESIHGLLEERSRSLDNLLTFFSKAEAEQPEPEPEPDAKRARLWATHMAARKPSEKVFKSKFSKCLMDARRATLANLDASEKALAGVRQRGVLDILFSLADFTAGLWNNMKAAHDHAIDEATQQLLAEVGRADDPWKMPPPEVQGFLVKRQNLMADTAHEIFDQVKAELQEGIDKGESQAELAKRVKSIFNDISNERATTIAATETGAAYGAARQSGMQGLGIEYKEWLSAQDERVRRTHRALDGTVIPMHEDFIVEREDGGHDHMQHPCDPAGSAGNCINCRCIQIAAE